MHTFCLLVFFYTLQMTLNCRDIANLKKKTCSLKKWMFTSSMRKGLGCGPETVASFHLLQILESWQRNCVQQNSTKSSSLCHDTSWRLVPTSSHRGCSSQCPKPWTEASFSPAAPLRSPRGSWCRRGTAPSPGTPTSSCGKSA